METINVHQPGTSSKKAVLTGRIISGLCIIFLLVDAIMKIVLHPQHVASSADLGWSAQALQPIGIALLACTILYMLPRTSILGAVLLTGYLGGAIAAMARIGQPFFFPFIFAVLVWGGLFLRDEKLREIVPFKRSH
jgi:hypothetical protein